VQAIGLRARDRLAFGDPLAVLVHDDVVKDARLPGGPAVAEEHVAAVVGGLHLQGHGQLLGHADVSLRVVADDAGAVGDPGEQQGSSEQRHGDQQAALRMGLFHGWIL